MRRAYLLAAGLVALALSYGIAAAGPGEAPFGLAWGPVDEVPRPLRVDREANLTALYYPRGQGPATGPATAEVVLVVCRDEGLQQVVWVGVPLDGAALKAARRTIHDEGVRRYGEPGPGPLPDSELWPDGRALLASREVTDGRRELVMTAVGPGYAACSRTHRAATGHPAGAHVADLLGDADR
ncbi:threonyl-trna synthetase [Methylobacterium oryzae]|uniref:Threonyl-trna synthetase n=1 Tax=Methylobacterium oryzae TaxID=334852 RepID=A0ABU7TZ27_9HYPH